MQIRHELRLIAECLDQIIIHIARVRSREPNTVNPANEGHMTNQLSECPFLPVFADAVISVDILTNERDFANAVLRQRTGFGDDLRDGAANFCAARIGDNAESAEFIAAFLDGQKARKTFGLTGFRQLVEFFQRVEFCFQHITRAAIDFGNHLWEFMISLRAKHHIDDGSAFHDFCAFGLGNTARDGDFHIRIVFFFMLTNTAEFRINFLGGFLANVTGVENDQIGMVGFFDGGVTNRGQHIGHALTVIDIHLTAIGLDENFFGVGFRNVSFGRNDGGFIDITGRVFIAG